MKSLLTKTLKSGKLDEILAKMMLHFKEHQFIDQGQFGWNGKVLMENLRQEWLLMNLVRCDEPAFPGRTGDFSKTLEFVENLPFSLIETSQTEERGPEMLENSPQNLFSHKQCTVLKKCTFCYPSSSTAFFHKLQRERKIWWRKFSALPGRFAFTEITANESGETTVQITADFDWCKQTVEVITLGNPSGQLKVKDGRNQVSPHVVTSQVNLELASAVYMSDAYDPINEENSREMLRLHRKLAPFKVTFVTTATTASVTKELSDLALVLARKMRRLGIPCLLLTQFNKKSLEWRFQRSDAMGIPYTVVLGEKTLQDGIISLRSRDTALKEQTHVGLVVPYMEKIMKNY